MAYETLARLASVLTYPRRLDDFLAVVDPRFSSRQLRGTVTSVTHETSDSATIRFRPGRGWIPHAAGQWARVGVEVNGVRQWRSYSLSTPAGADPAITVRAAGVVSTKLVHDTRPGDVLFLDVPEGDFVLPEHPRPLLMLTGGSGITPVMSMVRTLTSQRPDADVVVVHLSRTRDDAVFADELDDLAAAHTGLRVVQWHTADRGRLDLTDTTGLDGLVPDWRTRAAYVCGPAGLVEDAERLWASADVEDALTIERFELPTFAGEAGEGGHVTFTRSDIEVDAPGDATLLQVGEDAGVQLRSGCRIGICRTCLTPIGSGRVRDLVTGDVHGEPGDLIRLCVSGAAGDIELEA